MSIAEHYENLYSKSISTSDIARINSHPGEPVTVDSDRSIVSSWNYERYFEADGVLYHHILSTQTGYPVNSGLSQVTIISDDSVTGDALSTLCFILGYEKATTLLEDYPDVQAIFVLDDGSVISNGF